MKPKEYYEEMLRAQQHEIAARMARLRAKRWEIKRDAEREFDEQVVGLRQMSDEADRRIKALMDAGEESWHGLEETIAAVYGSVSSAAERALERFSETQLSPRDSSRPTGRGDDARR